MRLVKSPTAYVSFDKDNDIDKDTWDGLANGISVKATTVGKVYTAEDKVVFV